MGVFSRTEVAKIDERGRFLDLSVVNNSVSSIDAFFWWLFGARTGTHGYHPDRLKSKHCDFCSCSTALGLLSRRQYYPWTLWPRSIDSFM